MNEIIIKAEKLTKIYSLLAEEVAAVQGIDLEITKEEFVAIMGPSGSGKTTLLDMLGCLDSITSGTLSVLGNNVSHAKESALVKVRRHNISFVFQDFSLIPTLTALENCALPVYFSRKEFNKQKAIEILKRVGLSHRINHLPKQMSGGEQQRVAIARALVTEPTIVFADEPTGHLDTKTADVIFALLHQLNKEEGITVVVSTHNIALGMQANRTVFLQDGKIIRREDSSLLK